MKAQFIVPEKTAKERKLNSLFIFLCFSSFPDFPKIPESFCFKDSSVGTLFLLGGGE